MNVETAQAQRGKTSEANSHGQRAAYWRQQQVDGVNRLLDLVCEKADLRNDAALSAKLRVAPPVVSKLRHGKLALSPGLILKLHEIFGMPVADIRAISGVTQ